MAFFYVTPMFADAARTSSSTTDGFETGVKLLTGVAVFNSRVSVYWALASEVADADVDMNPKKSGFGGKSVVQTAVQTASNK